MLLPAELSAGTRRAEFLMRSAGTKRGRYMLTTDRLREILTAAIDQEAGTYVDALQERRILPDDGTALTPRSVIVALLALLSGERPVHVPACADNASGERSSNGC